MSKHSGGSELRATSARNAKIVRYLLACICVCSAFAVGFVIRGDASLLKTAGFESLAVDVDQNPGATIHDNTYTSISARVAEVEGILANESLDSYQLDEATTLVLNAFSSSTADPYLRYYDPARYATYVQESAGKYGGIGVLFAEYNGRAYAVDVFEGSVAEAAGVEQGDFVVSIDGDRGQAWSMTEVVNAITRDEGDSVVITWSRPATRESESDTEYTTTLKCSAYAVANVETELVDKVGYISLKQLTQNSAELVKNAVTDLTSRGAVSFVLDLRNNPGGYLTQAVDVASLFVRSGVIVEIDTKDGKSTKSATGAIATDSPLVVLVNGDTSAAGEVLAAALQDSKRATVVGTSSMGKGSVQVVRELSFGGALRYTAAFYKTPLGHDLNGVGITPHITIGKNDDAVGDNQKSLALETAASLIVS